MDLTLQEIDILIEALGDWTNAPSRSALTGEMIAIMLTPAEGREELAATRSEKMAESRNECREREEQAVMLKAKLIQRRRVALGTE